MNYAIRYGADPDFPTSAGYFSGHYEWPVTATEVFEKKTQGILYLSSNVSSYTAFVLLTSI